MKKLQLKKNHLIILIITTLILLVLGASQISGVNLKSDVLSDCPEGQNCDGTSMSDTTGVVSNEGTIVSTGYCGDNICDTDEDTNSCNQDCGNHPYCGNGTCDSGYEDQNNCPSDCPRDPSCGDNIVDSGEECDDGNTNPGDGCYFCKNEGYCGNEKLDGQEECDPASPDKSTNYCKEIKENNDYICSGFCECVLPQNKCGNKVVDEGEQCDDGNNDKGDGCYECKLEPYCGDKNLDTGEECDPASSDYGDNYCGKIKEDDKYVCSTFCECSKPKVDCSKFTLTGPGDIEEQETIVTTYEVRLSTQEEKKPKITSLSATAGPSNSPQVNVGGTNMNWEQLSIAGDGLSGILKTDNAKWYGLPDFPIRCGTSDSQSKYRVNVKANLDNGCEIEKEFQMQVNFAPGANESGAMGVPKIDGDVSEHITTKQRFFSKLFGGKNTTQVCAKFGKLRVVLDGVMTANLTGQYASLVEQEETYHVDQLRGNLPWSDGGWGGAQDVLDRLFRGQKICANGTDRDDAITKVDTQIQEIFNTITRAFVETDAKGYSNQRCWMEKRAKENIQWTADKGGLDFQCAYPECDPGMPPPESPADRMERALHNLYKM